MTERVRSDDERSALVRVALARGPGVETVFFIPLFHLCPIPLIESRSLFHPFYSRLRRIHFPRYATRVLIPY